MKISDFNIHLPNEAGLMVDRLRSELTCSKADFINRLKLLKGHKDFPAAGNLMVFNPVIFDDSLKLDALEVVGMGFSFTVLFDFRRSDWRRELSRLRRAGAEFIKFHAYIQRIVQADLERVRKVARFAEALGLGICIDASYGGETLKSMDNLEVALACIQVCKSVPIVILHFGGLRVIEFYLASLDNENVYFEMSFSLKFYEGSRVHDDLEFVLRKISKSKVLYASDHPYVSFSDSLSAFLDFLKSRSLGDALEDYLWTNFHLLQSKVRA